jgi:hypothetical protein
MTAEQAGADYVAFGTPFPSPTKTKRTDISLGIFREVKQQVRVPVFAIGGITIDNARQVIDAGADGIAVVSGVLRPMSKPPHVPGTACVLPLTERGMPMEKVRRTIQTSPQQAPRITVPSAAATGCSFRLYGPWHTSPRQTADGAIAGDSRSHHLHRRCRGSAGDIVKITTMSPAR